MLSELAVKLRQSLGIVQKQDIQALGLNTSTAILLGDDCAAIPDGDGYLLLAAEGIWPVLVNTDPWFAGWCAVMVNVSDVAAMGGRAIAVVDIVWSQSAQESQALMAGMKAASHVYHVPIVGGHTNCKSAYNALSVAILGRASQLITSFNAQPGDRLIAAVDLRGTLHPQYPFWNAATEADANQLRGDLEILPLLAEQDVCDTGKDISMGGIVGTLLMLMETSGCGAVLHLDSIPRPAAVPLETWLLCFPSYGFLLSVRPEKVAAVEQQFAQRHIACAVVGTVQPTPQIQLQYGEQSLLFWDLQKDKFTGFSPTPSIKASG